MTTSHNLSTNSLENWSQPEYAQEFRDNADEYIQDRASLLRITASLASHFLPKQGARVLDLGCGDGALALVLHQALPDATVAACDGSADMVLAARARLAQVPDAKVHRISFQDISAGQFEEEPFDGTFSCLAIHHLLTEEKVALFRGLQTYLKPGGYFLNADVALANHPAYENWYYDLWREWLMEREAATNAKQSFAHVPNRARQNIENHFDTLETQLGLLQDAGYQEVELPYRYGLFAIYVGRKG